MKGLGESIAKLESLIERLEAVVLKAESQGGFVYPNPDGSYTAPTINNYFTQEQAKEAQEKADRYIAARKVALSGQVPTLDE